jgi:hypothetical protein
MTFDLYWLEDPYACTWHRPPSYFGATHYTMAALRSEMRRQGMLKEVEPPPFDPEPQVFHPERVIDTGRGGIPTYKLLTNGGWVVTPTEIAGALVVASPDPAPPDHEATDPIMTALVARLAEHGLESYSPSQHALLTTPMERWVARWRELLTFMERAARHGGFVVA